MRWASITLCVLLMLFAGGVAAQEEDENRNWLTITVDAVNLRAEPNRQAEAVSARHQRDRLEAVGRNADGTWFQVAAPYSDIPLGWILASYAQYDFEVTLLPLVDTISGVTGGTPIVDTGISVEIIQNTRLRSNPTRTAEILQVVPHSVIIPAVARNPAGDWLQVNYNGTVGWVAQFLTRTVNDVQMLPTINPGGISSTAAVRVITAEMQIDQINRLRTFMAAPETAASTLSKRISSIVTGEIIPCEPINIVFAPYAYTVEDVRQLPELGRYGPTLNQAIADLNTAIELVGSCGVYTERTMAQATALLPSGFLAQLNWALDRLENEILS